MMHHSILCVFLGALCMLTACVTERENKPSRGTRLGSNQASTAQQKAEAVKASSKQADVNKPQASAAAGDAGISQPAPDAARTTSRVQVAVRPMGEVEYDGLTLPIVSPDGAFVAIATGQAPDWPAILAEPVGEAAPENRVVLLSRTDHGFVTTRAAANATNTRGLLVGRDATQQGVLVEAIEGVGSRRVGLLGWQTGKVQWLTPKAQRMGHAAIVPARGSSPAMAVCIRWTDAGSELVLLALPTASSEQATESEAATSSAASEPPMPLAVAAITDGIASFPTPFPDGSGVLVFVTTTKGVAVRAIPLAREAGVPPAFFQPAWGRAISSAGATAQQQESVRFAPYQAVAALQPSAFAAPQESSLPPDSIVIAHPGRGRLWRVSLGDGNGQLLPADAIAAAWWRGGWFLTREKDLAYVDEPTDNQWAVPARVIAEAFVPRVLVGGGGLPQRLLVVGPSKSSKEKLLIIELLPGG